MFLSFLFFAFVAYLVYKLLTGFVLPIYRTTRQVRKTFREMNQKMNGGQPGPGQQSAASEPSAQKKATVGEYIDFEEVKE